MFNPMKYDALQKKQSWSPMQEAKNDAALILQNALKNRNAKIITKKLRKEKKLGNAATAIQNYYRIYKYKKEDKQLQDASEKIRDNLLAYGARQNYERMVKAETPITTKTGETKTARDILLKSLMDYNERKLAEMKLKGLKRFKQAQMEMKPQSLMVVAPIIKREMPEEGQPKIHPAVEKYKNLIPQQNLKTEEEIKLEPSKESIYAKVVQDAPNSALSRLVELEGRQYIAKHLAQTAIPKLEQKLGLAERNKAISLIGANLKRGLAQRSMGIGRIINRMATTLPSLNLVGVQNNNLPLNIESRVMPPVLNPMTYARTNAARVIQNYYRSNRLARQNAQLAAVRQQYASNWAARILGAAARRAIAPPPPPPRNISALLKRARFGKGRRYTRGKGRKVAVAVAPAAPVRNISALLSRARFGKGRRYAGGRPRRAAQAPAVVPVAPVAAPVAVARRGRLVKGSQEARDFMARIRAMRGVKFGPAPNPVKDAAYSKPRGRPRKTPLVYGPATKRGTKAKIIPAAFLSGSIRAMRPSSRVFGPRRR